MGQELADLRERLEFFKASLCASMTALDNAVDTIRILRPAVYSDNLFDFINWREAGIRREELMTWWENHQTEDLLRREVEAKAQREAELRSSGMAKLSQEELKALGLLNKVS
jgi:hypothetical protein